MAARLRILAGRVAERFGGARSRVLVDAAPIMERTWAMLAGLGSVGRHGGLLVPGVGSRVWLGEIVLADGPAPEPDAPSAPLALCGDCRACMDACPTGAIVAPGVVDCRVCLSYHTIENRAGPLPEAVSGSVRLVFGCDACTAACPLEAPGVSCVLPAPPEIGSPTAGPAELAAMDDAAIARLAAGTCLARTGVAALRRNAALVASNVARHGIS
jgi:epoxyqueuosine reductase